MDQLNDSIRMSLIWVKKTNYDIRLDTASTTSDWFDRGFQMCVNSQPDIIHARATTILRGGYAEHTPACGGRGKSSHDINDVNCHFCIAMNSY
jgi:hypothetical protein